MFCLISAVCNTLLSVTFGDATNVIVNYVYVVNNTNSNQSIITQAEEELMEGLLDFVITTCSLGVGILISTYFATLLFNYSALRQVK